MISRPVRHSLPSTESEPRSDLVHMQFTRKNLLPSSEVELVGKYSYHLNTFFKEASFAACIWRGFSPLSYSLYFSASRFLFNSASPLFLPDKDVRLLFNFEKGSFTEGILKC